MELKFVQLCPLKVNSCGLINLFFLASEHFIENVASLVEFSRFQKIFSFSFQSVVDTRVRKTGQSIAILLLPVFRFLADPVDGEVAVLDARVELLFEFPNNPRIKSGVN